MTKNVKIWTLSPGPGPGTWVPAGPRPRLVRESRREVPAMKNASIKIIRLKGLHSNQKGSWDILQKPFFITELSYYEFGPQISQLHLIGSSSNSVWGTTLSHTFNDSLWPWPKSQPCQRTRPEKVAFLDFHGLSHVFFLRNGEVPRHGQGISNWQV